MTAETLDFENILASPVCFSHMHAHAHARFTAFTDKIGRAHKHRN